jgi:hypothetical protein
MDRFAALLAALADGSEQPVAAYQRAALGLPPIRVIDVMGAHRCGLVTVRTLGEGYLVALSLGVINA